MSELSDELTALEAEMATMRAELEGLRAQVGAATGRVKLTMREQTRCPACAGTTIVHAKDVQDGPYTSATMVLQQVGTVRIRRKGKIEAYVCRGCGLMEWYADLSDVDFSADGIRIIEGVTADPSAGPVR